MSEQLESPADRDAADADDQHVCQFPVAWDAEKHDFVKCGHPLEVPGGKGRPGKYCERKVLEADGKYRVHKRLTAFNRGKELKAAAAGVVPQATGSTARPVSSSRSSMEDLLRRWETVTGEHLRQQEALVSEAVAIVSVAGDPDAAHREVAAARRDAEESVRLAQARADEAEQAEQTARRELARALEDKALAEGAAEDALADRDAQVAEARQEAADATAAADREKQAAEAARADAAEQIATVQRQARDDIDAAKREAQDRIDESERAAAVQITAAHDARDAAVAAQHHAEAEQRAAEQAAADARAETERLRTQLADATSDAKARAGVDRAEITRLQEELAGVRAEARTEREQARADHAAEIARIQATADTNAQTLERALATAEKTITRLENQLTQRTEKKGDR